ncbi:MAG TPA: carbamoyltransferase HypF [Pyrinomonadaceae bacterium]
MKAAMKTVTDSPVQRLSVAVRGAVQGVGFRPFVHRLASEIGLTGWVRNSSQGVFIDVEGQRRKLDLFLNRLSDERPPLSYIQSLESAFLDAKGSVDFKILASDENGCKTAVVLPDAAVCSDCLREIDDPLDRRFRYPFTNCTNCGPRYSIIEAIPYDRRHTSMKKFRMCDACYAEYVDPADRRFHAQPNACPACGPRLGFWDKDGHELGQFDDPLLAAAQALREGEIVAVKGLGGFHLMVDARDPRAVAELRSRKHREEKPLAVMFPGLDTLREGCLLCYQEERLLTSPEAPIVLLRKRPGTSLICDGIAPGNPYIGALLPYTPLHYLLMSELGFPVVATSGNLSDEPICIDEHDAVHRLKGIADHFLVHDRPIVRHVDDSIVRLVLDRPMVLRRARGYAPLPVQLPSPMPSALAVGSHLKNSIAVSKGNQVSVSQHIGDLETGEAYGAFTRVIGDLEKLLDVEPRSVAHDLHPDYLSTAWGKKSGLGCVPVQHHYAHVLSCMAENEVPPPALGIAWDGTGYGPDGTIWGGEFLATTASGFERFAHFRTFPLPGGDAASREPRRSAIGLLYSIFGENAFGFDELDTIAAFSSEELGVIRGMLLGGFNSPVTSSAGRLFDAVASITGVRQKAGFEGQAAMQLEFAASPLVHDGYPFEVTNSRIPLAIDTVGMIRAIIRDHADGISAPVISARFHNTLAEIMLAVAKLAGEERIVLSGGCFQNKLLTELAVTRLRDEGFRVYWHQRIPPNDGGIALGQLAALAAVHD